MKSAPPQVFRTIVPVPAQSPLLRHADKITFLGSCFSDEVGSRLQGVGHVTTINPLGTIFNPVSLMRAVELFGCDAPNLDVRFCKRQQHFYSFDAGTSLVHEEEAECRTALSQGLAEGQHALQSSAALFLTLGSAWAYAHGNKIVANCHRQPQADFERRLLGVDRIESAVLQTVDLARSMNPDIRVVLTVSPVRHSREGFVESSRSKAHLLTAAHAVCEKRAGHVSYFPSYEIVMDELRDYRFFADDMLHPSGAAIDYVTTRLLETYFDASDAPLRQAVGQLTTARRHRHARPRSSAARVFAEAQSREVARLAAAYPHLALDDDARFWRQTIQQHQQEDDL